MFVAKVAVALTLPTVLRHGRTGEANADFFARPVRLGHVVHVPQYASYLRAGAKHKSVPFRSHGAAYSVSNCSDAWISTVRPPESEAEVKLSSVPNVSKLVFLLKPGLETDERAQKAIGATLQSWKVTAYAHNSDSLAHRQLYLRPWRGHDGNECSMKGFVDAVCKVGPLVEQVLCEQAPATEGSDKPAGMNVTVIVQLLGEDLEYGSRGRARVEEAFPTLSKLDRLSIISEDS